MAPVPAILYAPIGAACTGPLHAALKRAAEAGSVTYVLRPLLGDACKAPEVGPCAVLGAGEPLALPGWGVEAVLKNTEYSAMDDKDRKAEEAKAKAKGGAKGGASDEAAALGSHAGFDFDVLVGRKPALRQELLTLRDTLLSSDEEEAVKVWDIKDIGLQAAQRIQSAADPLALLTEIAQNFPALVSSLSRQKVDEGLRAAVTHNQQYISPGANFMLVNGLAYDINTFDFFGFLDRLRSELRLSTSLGSLGLNATDVVSLMSLRTEDASDALGDSRLDLGLAPGGSGVGHVVWLNDLEKDKMYTGRFSSSVTDILNTYPGRLRPMAVNIFTLVMALDPLSDEGLTLADMVLQMWQEYYPVRFGLTLCVPAVLERHEAARRAPYVRHDPPEWADMTTSERFARGFLALQQAFGGAAAFSFWSHTAQGAREQGLGVRAEEVLKAAYTAAWKEASGRASGSRARNAAKKSPATAWEDLTKGVAHAAEAGMKLSEMVAWQASKGIHALPAPTGWLNGMRVALEGGAAAQQDILYKVLMEQQKIQEAVYYGKLGEGDHVLTKMLAIHGAMSRWNPAIVGEGAAPRVVPLAPLVSRPEWRAKVPRLAVAAATEEEEDEEERDEEGRVMPKAGGGDGAKLHAATHIVAADITTQEGRDLLAQALTFLTSGSRTARGARVALLLNPRGSEAEVERAEPTMVEVVLHVALGYTQQFARAGAKRTPKEAEAAQHAVTTFLAALLSDTALATRLSGKISMSDVDEMGVVQTYAEKAGLDVLPGVLAYLDAHQVAPGGTVYTPSDAIREMRAAHVALARGVLGLEPGSAVLLANGRAYTTYSPAAAAGNATADETVSLVADDFALLTSLVAKYSPGQLIAKHVAEAHAAGRLQGLEAGARDSATLAALDDLVAAVSSALATSRAPTDAQSRAHGSTLSKQIMAVLHSLKGGAVVVGPALGASPSGLHVVCILNPLTRPAQRISQVLSLLRASPLAPTISLVLNPQRDLSELPLKSFYRYALPDLAPGGEGGRVQPGAPTARFSRLPRKRVLTLNMDVPEAWLVEAVTAAHDLDNLRLADIPESTATAELELSALMLTGSCIDVTAGASRATPPRGLQLHLGSPGQPHMVDTLVMSNLAYFQLKAAPGRWVLSLAPGRTQEIYALQSSTGITDAADAAAAAGTTDELSTQVVVSSLAGKHMILRVAKRPGKEREDVLKAAGEKTADPEEDAYGMLELDDDEYAEDDDEGGKGGSKDPKKPLGGDTINVFTVASGHMYERLQKIMILSVIKNTKEKVKFWLISNYMSPHHKQVIPAMAKQYGFEYEFVTYKWPHWLHKQTDKQRTIWAYKILFLDVLFPLGVERIIFVDSDQVVRTDLGELYHMDIKGAPYAYTPFCNNNKEMDEFRFWKGGFWAGHLQGKPYHISALYLVDLKRFRSIAAGDNLRVIYDQLSKDPNSLANLDQDLPNYAQHQIPIFSLPQHWLWCESWCGTATKAKAKTIDLCNNPKTKEPKLSAARRIITEWPSLDDEQAAFTAKVDALLGEDAGADTPASAAAPGGAAHDASEL